MLRAVPLFLIKMKHNNYLLTWEKIIFYCLLWWKASIKKYTPEIFNFWKMRFILSAHPMNSFTNYFHLLSCISELTLVTTVRPPSEAQSSLCGTQPAPDTRTSSRQPPSEAPTPRMSPTANLQSITASSWPGELNFSCSCLNWKIVYLWEAWYSVHKYQRVENHSNHADCATDMHTYWHWRLVNACFIMVMGG